MSGTLLAAPMVSNAEEAGNNSTTSSTNTLESTEGTGSTANASESTAGTGSTASPSAAATGTGGTVVTVQEAPVDPSTTLPNNVDSVIPDDETKGTEINSSISGQRIE